VDVNVDGADDAGACVDAHSLVVTAFRHASGGVPTRERVFGDLLCGRVCARCDAPVLGDRSEYAEAPATGLVASWSRLVAPPAGDRSHWPVARS
jgi:hypothetical protein